MERSNLFRLVSIVLVVFAAGLLVATLVLLPRESTALTSWARPADVLAIVVALTLLGVIFARYHQSFDLVLSDIKLLLGVLLPVGAFLFFANLQAGVAIGNVRWGIISMLLGAVGEILLLLQPSDSQAEETKEK